MNCLITVPIYQSRSEEIGDFLIDDVISKYCILDYINGSRQAIHVIFNEVFIQEILYKNKTAAPFNHHSLMAEHGIKSLSTILAKHLTGLGQMWPKYLPLAMFAHNTFNGLNLANYSPYELVFGRKPKLLLDLKSNPNIKVSGTFKGYYILLNKMLQHLHKLLQDLKLKGLAMINKDRIFFQYISGDLIYILSTLTSQLRRSSRKVAINYIGSSVAYKIIDQHIYLLMTLSCKILRGLF